MELYQILAVMDRDAAPRMEDLFLASGTQVGLSQIASGTAGNEILSRYGLAETEKRIVGTVATAAQQREIFSQARRQLYLDIPGNGILAAIPIKAVAGQQAL